MVISKLIILFLCALIVGTAKAFSDAQMSGSLQRRFNITDPNSFWGVQSWTRKYAQGNPFLGEKFFLSSNLLVFLTDGWHLMNACSIIAQIIALITAMFIHPSFLTAVIYGVSFWFIRTSAFSFFYNHYIGKTTDAAT